MSIFSDTFYINGSELVVKESDRLDFENQTEVIILVRTTDNGNPPLSKQVHVIVLICNPL